MGPKVNCTFVCCILLNTAYLFLVYHRLAYESTYSYLDLAFVLHHQASKNNEVDQKNL